jgi:CDP-diacylglycerol--glycerol-3-phosphate 3-phosphatidyltransferase
LNRLKTLGRSIALPIALGLGRLGFSPNALTLIGSLLTASVGLLVAQGWFVAAALCLWFFSATDSLDGALARATNRVSELGGFMDSVLDRYAEAAVFLGLCWWYAVGGSPEGVAITLVALVGSLMVSYSRARAEGLGYKAEVGWFQRTERIVLLGFSFLLAAWLPWTLVWAMGLMAVLTHFTVLQRFWHVSSLVDKR